MEHVLKLIFYHMHQYNEEHPPHCLRLVQKNDHFYLSKDKSFVSVLVVGITTLPPTNGDILTETRKQYHTMVTNTRTFREATIYLH